MAVTVALDGTNITLAESTTNWSKLGLISAPVQEGDIVLQGNYAVSSKASNKDGTLYYDYGSGLDFTSTYAGAHVYIWLNCTTLGAIDTQQNGGLAVFLGTSTTNYNEWYVLGSDTTDVYPGGWIRLVIDPRKPPSYVGGTGLSLSSIQYFGITINTTGSAKAENLIIDRIDVGWGLRIYGTDTDGWADVAANEETNRYGILQERDGVYFCYGRLKVGDDASTNGTTFSDTARVIRWVSQTYYLDSSATAVPSIGDDLFSFEVVSNSTNATSFTDGIVVGSGDSASGRAGTTFIGSDLHRTTADFDDGNNSSNDVNLYGSTFRGIDGGISFANDSDHACYGVTFSQCGQVDPVGAIAMRSCTFANTTHWRDTDLAAAIQDDASSYTDETTAANNATTDDMNLTPTTPANGDAYLFAHDRIFDRLDLEVSTAGSGFALTWQYWNGSWTALSGVVDETQAFSTTGLRTVSWTIPGDWTTTTVNSQGPFYYVRALVGSVSSPTQAKGEQAWLYGPPDGSALLWNSNIDIKTSQFLAHTDSDNDPHAIEHPAASAGETYYSLTFSGNDYDIDFSAASGTLTINVDTLGGPSTYEITGGGSTVSIVNTVSVNVYVEDEAGDDIENAWVYVQTSTGPFNDDDEIMREQTNASGLATESYNYLTDTAVTVRVRKAGYEPYISGQVIEDTGLTVRVTLRADAVYN